MGMADGYAQASGHDDPRQPAHGARRRQRDGRDLQRPGQPLAAAGHRRPAGARAGHAAGQPDQPRRDPDAAPAGQELLRAAAGRGRAACAVAGDRPRLAAAEGPGLRLDPDGRLGRRGRRRRRRPHDRAPPQRALRRRPGRARRSSPSASRAPPTPSSSPAPTSTPAAAGRRRSPSSSARTCPSSRSRRTGGGRIGFPEGHPNFRGLLPPAIGPVSETLKGRDLVLVVGSSVFPYYPNLPGPAAARGRRAGPDHERSRRGGAGADGRRDRRRSEARPRGAAGARRRVRARCRRVLARADRRRGAGSRSPAPPR